MVSKRNIPIPNIPTIRPIAPENILTKREELLSLSLITLINKYKKAIPQASGIRFHK